MKEQTQEFINYISEKGSVLGLTNMRLLMEKLGNVQDTLPIIHIAGTNGKGSVGCYLESLFMAAGKSVGRYVSPAVFHPLEIITIDGVCITKEEYDAYMDEIREACLSMEKESYPTIFEAETALAFLYFSRKKPDVVLIECGMGGESDATNVFMHPLASVVTSISMDHIRFLGPNLEDIARVKAGIIKEGCPVFSAPQAESVKHVLQARAGEVKASFYEVIRDNLSIQAQRPGKLLFTYVIENKAESLHYTVGLETTMAGHYQIYNAALAIDVFYYLMSGENLTEELLLTIQKGIADAKWPGRFEVVNENPLIIFDGAHNEGAAIELEKTLASCFGNQKLTMIMGVLADKDHRKMLEILLPHAQRMIAITPMDNPRALDGETLLCEAKEVCPEMELFYEKTYADALKNATNNSEPILVCGSLSYLGAMRKEL